MKQKIMTAALAAVLAAAPLTGVLSAPLDVTASASETENDFTYDVNFDDDQTVMIGRYTGTEENVVIPETLGGKPVVRINSGAFGSSVKSVTLPDSMDVVYFFAFSNCTSLESINVSENNTAYTSVDGVLFYKNMSCLVCYPAGKEGTSYTIPDSVTAMENGAFYNCAELESVTIPKSMKRIPQSAFGECTSLKTVIYNGTQAEWDALTILDGNECLTNAEIKCIGEDAPATPGETDPASKPIDLDPIDVTEDVKPGETQSILTDAGTVTVATDKDDTALEGAKINISNTSVPAKVKELVEAVIKGDTEKAKAVVDEIVSVISNGDAFALDISFTKDDKTVQPGKLVSVTVPVPEALKNASSLYVYHVGESGAELVKSEFDKTNGTITLTSDKFSPFIISQKKLANATGNDQAGTGIALAIAPAVLAAGAVIAISKKKNK